MSLKLNFNWVLLIKDELKQWCHSKWLTGKKILICPMPKPLMGGNSEIRKAVWGINGIFPKWYHTGEPTQGIHSPLKSLSASEWLY